MRHPRHFPTTVALRSLAAGLLLTLLGLAPACRQPATAPVAESPTPPPTPPATQHAPVPATAATALPEPAPRPRQLLLDNTPWTGDYDAMVDRRVIRVLVPYSRTLYFTDKGHERGITAELVRDFERYINRKLGKQLGKRPITVYLIPTTRDRLLPQLVAGLGDIAAGNLTVTDVRLKSVDFYAPEDRKPALELLITGPASATITRLDELAGRRVHVRPSSSYYESVQALSVRLVRAGRPAIRIVPLPEALEDEDVLEMLNAGLLEHVIVDDWKARIWAQVLPRIQVHANLVLRDEGKVGWAFRKQSPQLAAAIDDFYHNYAKKQGVIDYRLAKFEKNIQQIHNNTRDEEWRHFEEVIALFHKYGAEYDFDPLMLAAQGYQESRLRQDARSHVGAIGVMQIMPATGKELKVGDIRILEPNIHGGAKYMDQLMTRYFKDAKFSEQDRTLFAFASYNAGPGNISKMRREATRRGLDPDRWFNNVEIVTADRIGIETTTYVRNIYKYYVAYKLTLQMEATQRRARQQVAPGKPS
jgi:membrane-bound lytic murein transglycosylase MltF